MKSNAQLLKLTRLKSVRSDQWRQSVWAIVTCSCALLLNILPIDHLFSHEALRIIRSLVFIVALFCVIGVAVLSWNENNLADNARVEQKKVRSNNAADPSDPSSVSQYKELLQSQSHRLLGHASGVDMKANKKGADLTWSRFSESSSKFLAQQENIAKQQLTPQSSNLAVSKSPGYSSPQPQVKPVVYAVSPVDAMAPPLSVGAQLSSRFFGSTIQSCDAFTTVGLRDCSAVDDWVEKLKYILGKHLHDTLKRFDALADTIVSSVPSLPSSVASSVRHLLKLRTQSVIILFDGRPEPFDLEKFLTSCKLPRLTDEYRCLYAIFCAPGQSALGTASPALVARMRELASSHDLYLRINDGDRGRDVSDNHHNNTPASLDSEIVINLFFHLCDVVSESTKISRRFSSEHYIESESRIPMPFHRNVSSGFGVAGYSMMGIVRTNIASKRNSLKVTFTSPRSLRPAENEIGEFGVFVVRESVPHSATSSSPSSVDNVAGRTVLTVDSGRYSCLECIVVFLFQLVRLRHNSLAESSRGRSLLELTLDIFGCRDKSDLESMVADIDVGAAVDS